MSRSFQNPDHFTPAEAAEVFASFSLDTRHTLHPLASAPVIPPEIPRKPEPKKPKSLFQTPDHRVWFLPTAECEDAQHHHWRWDGQPYEDADGPVFDLVEDPRVHVPLLTLADPGFHSLSASHAGDDYIPAVTA